MSAPTKRLFQSLEKLCHGKAEENKSEIYQLKKWLTDSRESRPSGYMNDPRAVSAYLSYYLPLHLPEVFWILEQCKENKIIDLRPGEESFAPTRILDLGAGPGTASISLLLWMQTRNIKNPESMTLLDLSRSTLDKAGMLLESLLEGAPTKIEKVRQGLQTFDPRRLKYKYDFALMSHVMNEFGSGPRFRERKVQLLEKILFSIEERGHLLIIEPPLREPTLDLMWLRDEIAKTPELKIIAPCPRGVALCPMRSEQLGWCYSQPPRSWAHGFELAPWDKSLERSTGTAVTKPGFSYLLVQKDSKNTSAAAAKAGGSKHGISITDDKARDGMACTSAGVKLIDSPHRGAYVKAKE
jgi:ribosomal protein RSM22 (predicted rRNA methylase)